VTGLLDLTRSPEQGADSSSIKSTTITTQSYNSAMPADKPPSCAAVCLQFGRPRRVAPHSHAHKHKFTLTQIHAQSNANANKRPQPNTKSIFAKPACGGLASGGPAGRPTGGPDCQTAGALSWTCEQLRWWSSHGKQHRTGKHTGKQYRTHRQTTPNGPPESHKSLATACASHNH